MTHALITGRWLLIIDITTSILWSSWDSELRRCISRFCLSLEFSSVLLCCQACRIVSYEVSLRFYLLPTVLPKSSNFSGKIIILYIYIYILACFHRLVIIRCQMINTHLQNFWQRIFPILQVNLIMSNICNRLSTCTQGYAKLKPTAKRIDAYGIFRRNLFNIICILMDVLMT